MFDDYFREWTEANTFLAMNQLAYHIKDLANFKSVPICRIVRSDRNLNVDISSIREKHFNKLISIDGMIKKVGETRGRIEKGAFVCARCKTVISEQQEGFQLKSPLECYSSQNGCGRSPPDTKLAFAPEHSIYHDFQRIEVQESPDTLRNGRQPHSLNGYITHELVGTLLPGDRVTLIGVMELERSNDKRATGLVDKRLHIMSFEKKQSSYDDVETTEEDKLKIKELSQSLEIYDLMTKSIAPSIQGYEDVKESMMLQLFGGATKIMPDGRRLRGDIHILLAGDPGIAKSELGKYLRNIAPRAVYASGKGSSSAGLTAAAVKETESMGDGSKWTLEAGAMVRASGGLLIADEMDKMDKVDRQSLHGGMEQGCYDEQTEILTEGGWKYFKDLEKGDRVATLNENETLEYQDPVNYTAYNYIGEMYHIKSKMVDMMVTPDHKMYININKRADEWEGFKLKRMDELPPNKRMRFKKNCLWTGEERDVFILPPVQKYGNQNDVVGKSTGTLEIPMDIWLEFLGYYLSEGSTGHHVQTKIPYATYISQTKKENLEKINNCLVQLGFRYKYDGHNFVISSKQLSTYLSQYGNSGDKFVPREFMNLSSRQLNILYDALMLGDGCIGGKYNRHSYISSSKQLADDMTEIALKIGHSANIGVIKKKGTPTKCPGGRTCIISNDIHMVRILRKSQQQPNINANLHRNIIKRIYTGRVYCVEVPNHIIYVRRNGTPVWCGNCIHINKAGIDATLKTECSVLGIANPKYGRFDDTSSESLIEQINLELPLLSRFDLIYILMDKADPKRDELICDHVLKNHSMESYGPNILENDFIRKYIAEAKKITPVLSTEAKELIGLNYQAIRKKSTLTKNIGITPRQLDGYIRLSEASARVRLSKVVTIDDARRAIRLVQACLNRIDPDGAVDLIMTGTHKGERDKIQIIKDTLSQSLNQMMKEKELIEKLQERGMMPNDIEKILDKMRYAGDLVQPRYGYIGLV